MNQAKKKVLFHLPTPIDPGNYNGRQGRVLGVLKYFRDRKEFFEVHGVGRNEFGFPQWSSQEKKEILNFIDNVFMYDGERNLFDLVYTRSQSFYYQKLLRQQLPVDSDYFAPPGYVEFVRNLVYKNKYDFMWINVLDYAHLAAKSKLGVHSIIDLHDITSNFRLVRKNISYSKGFKFDYESNFRRELKLINKFDRVIIDAQDEMTILSSHLPSEKLCLVPTLIEGLSYDTNIVPYKGREFKYDLLFVGSNNQPNKEGLTFFLNSVFPDIVRRKPDTLLIIAGKIIQDIQIDASFKENIDCLGYVPDLADIYLKSRVAICPLVTGTGTKFKLVEAMAYAMPIVATKISASALSLIDGVNAFVTDDPRVYAEQILCLLNEPELAQKISQEVAITFKNEHSSSAVYSKLDEIFSSSLLPRKTYAL